MGINIKEGDLQPQGNGWPLSPVMLPWSPVGARRGLVWLHCRGLPGSGHGKPNHSSWGSRARWHCVSKKWLCVVSLKRWQFCFLFCSAFLLVRQKIPSPCKVNPNKWGWTCFWISLFVCVFSHCSTDPGELFLCDLGYMTLTIKNVGITYISFLVQSWWHIWMFFWKKEIDLEKKVWFSVRIYM